MTTQHATLLITLKSDACIATGDGFSSGIDIDTSLDRYGLPVIPGRRLKGCMRHAALDIGIPDEQVNAIFGVARSAEPGSLRVGNARLKNADALERIIRGNGFSREAVAAAFTQVRSQTAVEEDRAADNTLRFTRVVNHHSPLTGSDELQFAAPLMVDSRLFAPLLRIARATRNIGYRRNRGLGAVRCSIIQTDDCETSGAVTHFAGGFAYQIMLDEPLMVPRQGFESLDYIPGTSVLGFFASQLGPQVDDETFESLFLRDAVSYSPLYPVAPNGRRSLPAFGLLAKLKGSQVGNRDGAIVNLATTQLQPGEQPKPLKSGFLDPDTLQPVEVAREIVYHHSTYDEGTLYTQECIEAGQMFAGYITGPDTLLNMLESAISDGRLAFGRSKTAQYSQCSLVAPQHKMPKPQAAVAPVHAGDRIQAILDSDVLLDNGRAGYANDARTLIEAIVKAGDGSLAADDAGCTDIRYRAIGGYNAKWNQKKPSVRAYATGSCIGFIAQNDTIPSQIIIGEHTGEGLGRVLFRRVDGLIPCEADPENRAAELVPAYSHVSSSKDDSWISVFRRAGEQEQLQTKALDTVRLLEVPCITASFAGRLLRMAEQASSAADFDARISSIKNDAKRTTAVRAIAALRADIYPLTWEREQMILEYLFGLARIRAKRERRHDD